MARIKLRGGQSTLDRRLDRLVPGDFRHFEKFPLTLETIPDKPAPVVLGINWYSRFDTPVPDSKGRWWIRPASTGSLGNLRGGHAICVKCGSYSDPLSWWTFYDQLAEGACAGFSASRMMSLWNRSRYFAPWLYKHAQVIDEWPGENYDGTSVRAVFEVLRTEGHCKVGTRGAVYPPDPAAGISVYRWAQSVEEIHEALKMPLSVSLGAVPLLNSWGRDYPHVTWMPDEIVARLLTEEGEAGLATDK